jgi:hypothetical protein
MADSGALPGSVNGARGKVVPAGPADSADGSAGASARLRAGDSRIFRIGYSLVKVNLWRSSST